MISFNEILTVVESFYKEATHDFMIGYHFRKIDNFEEHIPHIANFWYLQLNGNFHNKPEKPFDLINNHKPLGIKKGEINRWMILFNQTLDKSNLENELKKQWKTKLDFFKDKIENALF